MLTFARKTMDSPQLEAAMSALYGAITGLILATLAAWLLGRRNLRASFALVLLAVPGWLCWRMLGEPFVGALLVTGGLLGGALRRLRITGALKAGGELAAHARRARTIRELARNWRDRRRLRKYGPMDWPGTYVLGEDEHRALVRLPIARDEGRHMLLIGATGAGKTTTLSSVLWRHVQGGCGAILDRPEGRPGAGRAGALRGAGAQPRVLLLLARLATRPVESVGCRYAF